MALTHNLNLKTKVIGSQKLLSWDGLHNAHEYIIYKSGISYLTVDSNRSLTLPDDSYQVYAKTWQNDESLGTPVPFPSTDYNVTLHYDYVGVDGNDVTIDYTLYGVFNTRQKTQLETRNVYTPTVRFHYQYAISIVAFTFDRVVFRVKPKVKTVTYGDPTYTTLVDLYPIDLNLYVNA